LLLSLSLLELEVSIHAPREGCDLNWSVDSVPSKRFNSRTPGGVRLSTRYIRKPALSFNSRTPGGVRLCIRHCLYQECRFNSRTPGGVRHPSPLQLAQINMFQFTHPGRGATGRAPTGRDYPTVSIHAPREGCDLIITMLTMVQQNVSIHAPREGCDFHR